MRGREGTPYFKCEPLLLLLEQLFFRTLPVSGKADLQQQQHF